MPKIALPQGLSGVENLPKTKVDVKNLFFDGKGNLLSRPSIEQINVQGGVARGSFTWNGSLYKVYSQELRKITNLSTGAYSVVGAIEGPQPIEWAKGFNEIAIIVRGGKSYYLDKSDTLTDTSSNSNFVSFIDVCHINGKFIYVPADGSPTKFSDVGDAGTIQAASFFDAEELPDLNNACFNQRNTLHITGTDSIELFRDNGTTFTRVTGARIDAGYIGGLLEYNKTHLFIGRYKEQGIGIYAIAQGDAPKISNERIDLVLSTYTQEELEETVSSRFMWRGYDLATFTLRRHSFLFYGGRWFELDTLQNGESKPWAGGYITQFDNTYYTAYEDKLGKLVKGNTDFGEKITRIISFGIEQENKFSAQSLYLGVSQGYNDNEGSVALQVSKDNVLYSQPVYRRTGKKGEYSQQLDWNPPGGLGHYDKFMGVKLYTTEDIDFSINNLEMKFR